MVFDIEKLASSLCLVYATDKSLDDVPLECFDLTDAGTDVWEVISKIENIFYNNFEPILDEIIKYHHEELIDYMRAVLSRFVKISDEPSYFNFLLLCSLSYRIVFDMFAHHKCYTLAKMVSLCLMAVYERCYKDFFNMNGVYESLEAYCKKINPLLSEDGMVGLSPGDRQGLTFLIASMTNSDCAHFPLTEKEVKMIADVEDFVPPHGFDLDSSIDDFIMERQMNSLTLNEHNSKANDVCRLCDSTCEEFLLIFEAEAGEMLIE